MMKRLTILSVLAASTLSGLQVHAQTRIARETALYAERYSDAPSLAKLAANTVVKSLKSEAGWVQVNAGGKMGWVRASALSGNGAVLASVAQLESGRTGGDNITNATGVRAPSTGTDALLQLHGLRQAERTLRVNAASTVLQIGSDTLALNIVSPKSGFVSLLMVGAENQEVFLLFPNTLDQQQAITAHQALSLPRATWPITAGGPAGKDLLLVIVSDKPLDWAIFPTESAGPFRKIPLNTIGDATLQGLLATKAGPTAFAASLLEILEVQ